MNNNTLAGLAAIDECFSPHWRRPAVPAPVPSSGVAIARGNRPTPAARVLTSAEILADRSKPLELRCLTAWNADPAIRSEYRSVVVFEAYQRASEAGRIKIYHGAGVRKFSARDFAN